MEEDVFRVGKIPIGVPVLLKDSDSFNIIKETLTRIGIANDAKKILYQSAHILHKRGQYAIVSFKELFMLDGKHAFLEEGDLQRRNTIAYLLQQWGLLTIQYPDDAADKMPVNKIRIIPFKEKENWSFVQKYSLGKKENYNHA